MIGEYLSLVACIYGALWVSVFAGIRRIGAPFRVAVVDATAGAAVLVAIVAATSFPLVLVLTAIGAHA